MCCPTNFGVEYGYLLSEIMFFFLVCFVVVVVVIDVIVFELKMFGPEVCVLHGLRKDFA